MSRNKREGRYAGFHRQHIRSKWHGSCEAPFSSIAFGVMKTRADQRALNEHRRQVTGLDLFLRNFIGDENPVLLRAARENFARALLDHPTRQS